MTKKKTNKEMPSALNRFRAEPKPLALLQPVVTDELAVETSLLQPALPSRLPVDIHVVPQPSVQRVLGHVRGDVSIDRGRGRLGDGRDRFGQRGVPRDRVDVRRAEKCGWAVLVDSNGGSVREDGWGRIEGGRTWILESSNRSQPEGVGEDPE